jgi:hypothetical protein
MEGLETLTVPRLHIGAPGGLVNVNTIGHACYDNNQVLQKD